MSDEHASAAVSADGVPIRYAIEGSSEPTLLFVHGWAFDRHLWDPDVRRLRPRHRVVTLDLAGHGESGGDRRGWTMAAFGEDVKAVADAVGPERLILVGHSMGGLAVLEAARRMKGRVQAIVLVDIVLDAAQRMPADEIETHARRLEADYEAATRQMAEQFLLGPAATPDVRAHVVARTTKALPPALSIALLREVWAYDPVPALREIDAPIRAVSADKFPTNFEGNRRFMPGYEAAIVHGTGHYPMLEKPARFASALDEVLGPLVA
jgi:pimeloyl-ACP methyl ester carboxylesterase